ncbi:MAG: hypothetical protein ACKVW3_11425 [Phycisphaerales bacterium]
MAKTLTTPPPSSSVARMFDVAAAAAAIGNPLPVPHAVPPPPREVPQRMDPEVTRSIKREVILTTDTDETLTRCLAAMQKGTRTRLNTSHLVRAILRAMEGVVPALESQGRQLGPLRLPGNGPGTGPLREAFERRIAAAIVEAFKQGRGRA